MTDGRKRMAIMTTMIMFGTTIINMTITEMVKYMKTNNKEEEANSNTNGSNRTAKRPKARLKTEVR